MNLTEDLMPSEPTLRKQRDKKSVQSDTREFNLLEDVFHSTKWIPPNNSLVGVLPLSQLCKVC